MSLDYQMPNQSISQRPCLLHRQWRRHSGLSVFVSPGSCSSCTHAWGSGVRQIQVQWFPIITTTNTHPFPEPFKPSQKSFTKSHAVTNLSNTCATANKMDCNLCLKEINSHPNHLIYYVRSSYSLVLVLGGSNSMLQYLLKADQVHINKRTNQTVLRENVNTFKRVTVQCMGQV